MNNSSSDRTRFSIWTPLGWLVANTYKKRLTSLSFSNRRFGPPPRGPFQQRIKRQFEQYFSGKRKVFAISVALPSGTSFERIVWTQLQRIRYGNVTTYSELARAIDHPGSARAVGNAVGKNPLLFIVPCHRVVRKDGIGGFTGGIGKKIYLLRLETTSPERIGDLYLPLPPAPATFPKKR